MLLVSPERRREVLIKALEIAIGVNEVNDSPTALRAWSDLVLAFRRDKIEAGAMLQHLKTGAVFVCPLAPAVRESDKAPA